MASNFFRNYRQKPKTVKEEGTPLTSDQDFLSFPIGTMIVKNTGDEYKKVQVNVYDKLERKVISFGEIHDNFPDINGDNSFQGDNHFEGNTTVDGTGSFGNIVVNNNANMNHLAARDINCDTLNARNSITSPYGYLDNIIASSVNPRSSGYGNLGSSGARWGTAYINEMYGTASSARYSDLAEKYLVDQDYQPGTVLQIDEDGVMREFNGGTLAGAVATAPGYRLNSDLEATDDTFVKYVCLKGIIPVLTDYDILPGQYCIATFEGKVKPVNREDMTMSDFLDLVGICYQKTGSNGRCIVKV